MRKRIGRFTGVALLALMSGGAMAQDAPASYDLRPLWSKGQASHYRITQTEVDTADLGQLGQPSSSTELTVDLSWQVLRTDDAGGGTAQMTIDKITMKITDPKGGVHAVSPDHADPGMDGAQKWAGALSGSPLEVSIGPDGTIGSITGIDAIHQKAPELAKKLNQAYFKELAEDLAVLAGGKADVKPGATWATHSSGTTQNGKLEYDATNRLVGVDSVAGIGLATVERTARMSFEPELPELPPEAPPISVKMTRGEYHGKLMYDLSRHELAGARFDQTLELQVSVTVQGQTIHRSTTEATTTQVLRVGEQ